MTAAPPSALLPPAAVGVLLPTAEVGVVAVVVVEGGIETILNPERVLVVVIRPRIRYHFIKIQRYFWLNECKLIWK